MSVAAVWRMSCSRMRRTPASRTSRSNRWVTRPGVTAPRYVAEHEPLVEIPGADRETFFELAGPVRFERAATVAGSSATTRRLAAPFGSDQRTWYPTLTSVRRPASRPASISTSSHLRPSASPHRSPVVSNVTQRASRRSPARKSRNARASLTFHQRISLSATRARSTSFATFRATSPAFRASSRTVASRGRPSVPSVAGSRPRRGIGGTGPFAARAASGAYRSRRAPWPA